MVHRIADLYNEFLLEKNVLVTKINATDLTMAFAPVIFHSSFQPSDIQIVNESITVV